MAEWTNGCGAHTLISLGRLADRDLISEEERTQLSEAYVFLRALEHRLQMEHGLQTHTVPESDAQQVWLPEEWDSQVRLRWKISTRPWSCVRRMFVALTIAFCRKRRRFNGGPSVSAAAGESVTATAREEQ